MPLRNIKIFATKLISDAINSNNNNNYELNPDLVESIIYETSLGAGSFGVVYRG
jgi:hypothetical protein